MTASLEKFERIVCYQTDAHNPRNHLADNVLWIDINNGTRTNETVIRVDKRHQSTAITLILSWLMTNMKMSVKWGEVSHSAIFHLDASSRTMVNQFETAATEYLQQFPSPSINPTISSLSKRDAWSQNSPKVHQVPPDINAESQTVTTSSSTFTATSKLQDDCQILRQNIRKVALSHKRLEAVTLTNFIDMEQAAAELKASFKSYQEIPEGEPLAFVDLTEFEVKSQESEDELSKLTETDTMMDEQLPNSEELPESLGQDLNHDEASPQETNKDENAKDTSQGTSLGKMVPEEPQDATGARVCTHTNLLSSTPNRGGSIHKDDQWISANRKKSPSRKLQQVPTDGKTSLQLANNLSQGNRFSPLGESEESPMDISFNTSTDKSNPPFHTSLDMSAIEELSSQESTNSVGNRGYDTEHTSNVGNLAAGKGNRISKVLKEVKEESSCNCNRFWDDDDDDEAK